MGDLDPLIDALTDLLDEWDGEGLIDGDETMEHFLADGLTRKGWSFQPSPAASSGDRPSPSPWGSDKGATE